MSRVRADDPPNLGASEPVDGPDPPGCTASSDADWWALDKGMPLADFECKHGRLAGDRTPVCGCWPHEVGVAPEAVPEAAEVAA